jgi:predicted  nucleic acid-binding Zn-ribbon protein
LEKEIFAWDKRRGTAKKQLDSVCERIEKLQKEIHDKQSIKTCGDVPARPLKTMAMHY